MYTFAWLCKMMQERELVSLVSGNEFYRGTINGIAVEDGSGKNWLVTIALNGGGVKTIFVKAE